MKRKDTSHRSSPHQSSLSEEDHALWHQVRKTVEPLKERDLSQALTGDMPVNTGRGNNRLNNTVGANKSPIAQKQQPVRSFHAASYSPPTSRSPVRTHSIDDKTARNLLKGKVSIDGRIDLHGMTQQRAHDGLLRYLAACHARGDRMVLVITGKGRTSEGVLRQMVPNWLREPVFSVYVSAFRTAHVTHGGQGALYVRLRRQPDRGTS